jgi:hypothetical protein
MEARTLMDAELLLRRLYAAFEARDLEGALATMHPEVQWPNGWWEGAGVRGEKVSGSIGSVNGGPLTRRERELCVRHQVACG